MANLLVEHEDVVFEVLVESLQLGDLLLESVAAVIGTAQLFSPLVLLALIGAKLRSAIWITVLTSQSMR